jgi:hypothetical protein
MSRIRKVRDDDGGRGQSCTSAPKNQGAVTKRHFIPPTSNDCPSPTSLSSLLCPITPTPYRDFVPCFLVCGSLLLLLS